MSLATIAYDMNEAYAAYGITTHGTPTTLIGSTIIAFVLMYYFIESGLFFKFADKYLFPEALLMLVWILLIDMLIMKGAYQVMLFLALGAGFFYILFTDKRYEKHKDVLLYYLDKIF